MLSRKKITDIVDENYVFASVLFYFGIKFYDYSDETLKQVCKVKGLNLASVVRDLENVNKKGIEHKNFLLQLPIDLIVEFLKHSHYIYIKQKLPYIAQLINALHDDENPVEVIKDLKWIFPVFIEDFIHHVYKEEDTLFDYILSLNQASRGKLVPSKLYLPIKSASLQRFAVEHKAHEEELHGIRKITNGYKIEDTFERHLVVVYRCLHEMENELVAHASIENEILLPRALSLEKEVLQKVAETARWN